MGKYTKRDPEKMCSSCYWFARYQQCRVSGPRNTRKDNKWPEVKEDDWCGRWKSRIEEEKKQK